MDISIKTIDVPKVPIYHCSLTSVWNECPNCRTQPSKIGDSKYSRFGDDYYIDTPDRCPHCGQKLLWDWDLIDKKAHKTKDYIEQEKRRLQC